MLQSFTEQQVHREWLQQALSSPVADPPALATFLLASTPAGLPVEPQTYGCLWQWGKVGVGVGGVGWAQEFSVLSNVGGKGEGQPPPHTYNK
jgi:hypothetical protein